MGAIFTHFDSQHITFGNMLKFVSGLSSNKCGDRASILAYDVKNNAGIVRKLK